jgi:hypothetical protein
MLFENQMAAGARIKETANEIMRRIRDWENREGDISEEITISGGRNRQVERDR